MTAKQRRLKIHHGKRLEQLLKAMDISVSELHRKTNVTRNTIVAKLKAEEIEDKYILAFSEALGIDPTYFAGSESPDSYAAVSLTIAKEKIALLHKEIEDLKAQNVLLSNQLSINARFIEELERQLLDYVKSASLGIEK